MPNHVRDKETEFVAAGCRLDHDGCVVCADAGIPVRVLSISGDDALCEDGVGTRASIAIDLMAPVTLGEILITHGGVAIGRRLDDALASMSP